MTPDQFADEFPQMFSRSSFRLEQLASYVAANEAEPYRRFRVGQAQDPAWREPWKRFVRAAAAEGRTMARVHVVDEPLSEYLRFELSCAYPANVEAGEDVRIIRRPDWPGLWLPNHDYYVFDSERVARLTYADDGSWIDVDVTDDPGEVQAYCQVRDLAMERSAPVGVYLRQIGLKEAM